MENYVFNQRNGLWYKLQGNYYIPCLVLEKTDTSPIGMRGRKHQQYLKEHHPMLYSDLVLSRKLYSYLAAIDTQARNKLHLLVTQPAKKESIAEEIILRALIYGEDGRMSLLEEFWYGNIEPTEYCTSDSKEYKEALRLIARNEEKIQATMTDEQKELFSRYTDAVREYQTMAECLLFQNSFKLGARMTLEILKD